jgi:hypothetical protein
LAIKHKLRTHKTELSVDDAQIIENKWSRLQTLINVFENQADTFLVHTTLVDDPLISPLDDYDEFDHTYDDGSSSSPHHSPMAQDGSNMDTGSPEDIPITLPSSFGWKWCVSHNAKSLAVKEAQLRHAQANDAIHQICLTLGFKLALFRTHVRPANTQQTKTCVSRMRISFSVCGVEVLIIRYDKMVSHMTSICAFVFVIKACDPGKDLPYHSLDMCTL